jgi:hypothetical protein
LRNKLVVSILFYISMSRAVEVADDNEEEFTSKCGALLGADFPRQMLTNVLNMCIYLCPIYHTI